jgi:hypothetical protein
VFLDCNYRSDLGLKTPSRTLDQSSKIEKISSRILEEKTSKNRKTPRGSSKKHKKNRKSSSRILKNLNFEVILEDPRKTCRFSSSGYTKIAKNRLDDPRKNSKNEKTSSKILGKISKNEKTSSRSDI